MFHARSTPYALIAFELNRTIRSCVVVWQWIGEQTNKLCKYSFTFIRLLPCSLVWRVCVWIIPNSTKCYHHINCVWLTAWRADELTKVSTVCAVTNALFNQKKRREEKTEQSLVLTRERNSICISCNLLRRRNGTERCVCGRVTRTSHTRKRFKQQQSCFNHLFSFLYLLPGPPSSPSLALDLNNAVTDR